MTKAAILLLLASLAGCSASELQPAGPVAWQPWGEAAFAKAKAGKKLVLLDLGAVWCHWCHVMDKETYGNPAVERELADHWVAVHVNQDERPDLANRYEDYGWPATILFDADGRELAKFRGFMEPKRLLSLLEAFDADPTPGPSAIAVNAPSAAANPALPRELDDTLHAAWEAAYDRDHAGWGTVLKYLDPDCVELAMVEGRDDLARPTLDAMLQLIDPAWGGVYQYSHGGVWTNPHFEKIMSFQAEDMRIYALAYRVYGDVKYLKAAKDIERYLMNFLRSPEGAFYASQDADLVQGEHGGEYFALDDKGRRAKGMPRIDKHLYARENGWAIAALGSLGRSTADEETRATAVLAADWTVANRDGTWRFPGFASLGFRHDEDDRAGVFLSDSLAMARAFYELHLATQDGRFLERCEFTLHFIEDAFRGEAGYVTGRAEKGDKLPAPGPHTDENIGIARLAIRMHHATGAAEWKAMAEHAMKYLAGVAPGANGVRAAGILLAARELAADPVKVIVVGAAADDRTRALLAAARSSPGSYLIIRRLDPEASAEYPPDGNSPTAYVCSDGACSSPLHDPGALRKAATPDRRR
ncbi:MAG: DUF255 domain-containing protein [Planctomycetes bacterium]|nr:DUF255 domain-containing protein [Planctomycetota bacterium]